MKHIINSLAVASFALLSFFSCSSLSAQTDALVVAETGNVGVGTARPDMTQIRGPIARIMPHFPIFKGQTHDLLPSAGNMLLFRQPETPILLQILLANATDRQDTPPQIRVDSRSGGETIDVNGASHHDNWRENQ